MNTNQNGENSTSQPNSESVVDRTGSSQFNEQDLASILRRDFGNLDDSEAVAEPADNNGSEDQFEDTSVSQDYSDSENVGEEVHSQEEEATDSENSEFQTKGVQKRIDKLTALRKQAEEQADKLQKEVDNLKAKVDSSKSTEVVVKSDDAVPYANLNSIAEIEQEIAQARSVRRWCEENSNGVVVQNADGTETEYSYEDVKRIKLNAMDAMEEHLPKRLNYIQTKARVDSVAYKEYPWLKDKSSKERQIAESFIKAFPQITRFPDYNVVIGDYIRGMQARENANKGRNVQRAPHQPASNYASPSRYKDSADPDATKRYAKSNSSADLAAIIKSKFI
jgi:hypothetical protein